MWLEQEGCRAVVGAAVEGCGVVVSVFDDAVDVGDLSDGDDPGDNEVKASLVM